MDFSWHTMEEILVCNLIEMKKEHQKSRHRKMVLNEITLCFNQRMGSILFDHILETQWTLLVDLNGALWTGIHGEKE